METYNRYSQPGIEHRSPAYQATFSEAGFDSHHKFIKHLVEQPILKGKMLTRHLDIGCNSGYTTSLVAEYFKETVGVDPSEPLIQVAATNFPSMSFLAANAKNLPFPDDSFDCTTALHSLNCMPNKGWVVALSEIFRVTKPGGIVLLDFPPRFSRLESIARTLWYFVLRYRSFNSSIAYFKSQVLRTKRKSLLEPRLPYTGICLKELSKKVSQYGGKIIEVHQPKKDFFRRYWLCGVIIEKQQANLRKDHKPKYCSNCFGTTSK